MAKVVVNIVLAFICVLASPINLPICAKKSRRPVMLNVERLLSETANFCFGSSPVGELDQSVVQVSYQCQCLVWHALRTE